MILNKIAESLGELYGQFKKLFRGQIEYIRLTMLERGAKAGGMFIISMIFMLMVFMILLMLCFALTSWFYTLLDSFSLAFLSTAGVLTLLTLIVYLLRVPLIMNPVLNSIVKFLKSNKDE